MFPDGVETITMTKNDYDRNVEQLLFDKIDAQLEIERLHSIIKEVREYITYWHYRNDFRINSFTTGVKEELLEILERENNDARNI